MRGGVRGCLIIGIGSRCHTALTHTTNYVNTLIMMSPDTKAVVATAPPTGKASVAELQFAALRDHDYELTSDDVIFGVFTDRKGIAAEDRRAALDQFFSRGQACLRTSPLAKSYRCGIQATANHDNLNRVQNPGVSRHAL